MHANAQSQSDQPFVYERTFLRTVLCLRGVEDVASDLEIEEARNALRQYELSMERARTAQTARPSGWLRGRMAEPAAVEHAFMFVRFRSVLPPNAGQLKALNDWLGSHKLP
ncbi:MAG: hypothetical protein ABI645_07090 [Pseudomonadota bacterium]